MECDTSSPEFISGLGARLIAAVAPNPAPIFNTVINNAAILFERSQDALTLTAESMHKHMQTNVTGPALLLQAILPFLEKGSIVGNISSGIGSLALLSNGTVPPTLSSTPYSMSKAALNMLTIHQAYVLRKMGIVVVVCVLDMLRLIWVVMRLF